MSSYWVNNISTKTDFEKFLLLRRKTRSDVELLVMNRNI